ncbi:MAG TPA: thiamine pyrophosphate-dependent dehydrogenase E1 component subunit alpha, partial [Myxococcota bacterium]
MTSASSRATSAKKSSSKSMEGAPVLEKDGTRPSDEQLTRAFQTMVLSRLLDEKMLVLLKQGKGYFHIGCMGHEAVQTATAHALTAGRDWAYPYYRDQALCLGLGMTAYEIFSCFLARADDPNSGGRQMPQHYGHRALNIPSQSSPTGTQFLQAVGCALASMRKHGPVNGHSDLEVTVVGTGDGTTSQGDFHEALNWASRAKAPVIFLVEDNGFAISVPVTDQTPGGKVVHLGRGYDGLESVEVDGCDYAASLAVMERAVARARAGEGPTLVVANVVRLLPHSNSDDQRKYRAEADLAKDKARDPVAAMRKLVKNPEAIEAEIKAFIDSEAERAEKAPMPPRASAKRWVLSEQPEPPLVAPALGGDEIVLVDAINRALAEELERDPR